MLTGIFGILDKIKNSFQPTWTENWGYLNISGEYGNENKSSFNELNNIFTASDIQSALTFLLGQIAILPMTLSTTCKIMIYGG